MYNREDSELKDIIEGFQMLGPDSGGLVNPNELKEIMDIMNMGDKNPFIYNIIQNLCSDEEVKQKGGIDAKDFISLLNQELDDTSNNDEISNIFSIFANPSTNSIPLSVFSQIIGNGENFIEEREKFQKLIEKPEINGKELSINMKDFFDFNTNVESKTKYNLNTLKGILNQKQNFVFQRNEKGIFGDYELFFDIPAILTGTIISDKCLLYLYGYDKYKGLTEETYLLNDSLRYNSFLKLKTLLKRMIMVYKSYWRLNL